MNAHLLTVEAVFTLPLLIPRCVDPAFVVRCYVDDWGPHIAGVMEPWTETAPNGCEMDFRQLRVAASVLLLPAFKYAPRAR